MFREVFDELVTLRAQEVNKEIDEMIFDTGLSNYNERNEKNPAGTANHLNSYAAVGVRTNSGVEDNEISDNDGGFPKSCQHEVRVENKRQTFAKNKDG